jgi:hypothetical protein
MTTPTDVQALLVDMEFPATKEQVIEHARWKGAAEDLLSVLERLPRDSFDSAFDVSHQLGAWGGRPPEGRETIR